MLKGAANNILIAGVLLVLLAPGFAAQVGGVASPPSSGPNLESGSTSFDSQPNSTVNISLIPDGAPTPLSAAFWGVDGNAEVGLGAVQGSALNATPVRYVVWPGGRVADRLDMISNVGWTNGTSYRLGSSSETQFVAWCQSVGCHAILQVPGEINNPSFAEREVWFTENTSYNATTKGLGFRPAYWEIGNEPALWMHWNESWANWRTSDSNRTTPIGYAEEVEQYVDAMRAADSSIEFIGLPGVGTGTRNETSYLNATVSLNGPNLSAVAIHVYPAGDNPSVNGSISHFYDTLYSPSSLTTRVPADVGAINAACLTCHIQLFVTEYNAADLSLPGGFLSSFADVPFVAAEIADAINSTQVANLDYYDLQSSNYVGSWLNASNSPGLSYALYSTLLPQVQSEVQPVSVSGPHPHLGVFAALTENQTSGTKSLLVANANSANTIALNLAGLGLTGGAPSTTWTWNNSSGTPGRPIETEWAAGLHTPWVLPPESVALLLTPTFPVTFEESGLPVGINWSVTFDSLSLSTTTSLSNHSLSFPSEPNGTYPYSIANLSGWQQRTILYQGTLNVSGSGVIKNLSYGPVDYNVTFNESGLPYGLVWSVTFNGTTASMNTTGFPANLSFPSEPNGSYAYSIANVSGYALNNLSNTGHVSIQGKSLIVNVSYSRLKHVVRFVESGLPAGEVWAVKFDGLRQSLVTNASTDDLPFPAVPPGMYNYSITPIFGWSETSVPLNGTLNVQGMPIDLNISYFQDTYSLTFSPRGLASGVNWSVTVNGSTEWNFSGGPILFTVTDGVYDCTVGVTPGWIHYNGTGMVTVNGTNLSVEVRFLRTYSVTFNETGLRSGANWTATLNGTKVSGIAHELNFIEPNGSYSYAIRNVSEFNVTPSTGRVNVSGFNVTISVHFSLHLYSVRITESGLPPGTFWDPSISGNFNSTFSIDGNTALGSLPNGSYVLRASTGNSSYAPPSPIPFNVSGSSVFLSVNFTLVTYPVTFTESGLPTYDTWYVNISGHLPQSSTGANPTMQFNLSNGSYDVNVTSNDTPHFAPYYDPRLIVNGEPVSVSVSFKAVMLTVTFTETGLPGGTTWSITTGGKRHPAEINVISFPEVSGKFAYRVACENSSYIPAYYRSNFSVNVTQVSIAIHFTLLTFTVTVTESGLPSGLNWNVTLGNSARSATATSLSFVEPNGTYAYRVAIVAGWRTIASGEVTVSGSNVTKSLEWSHVYYSVTLSQTGLPHGANWSITVGGMAYWNSSGGPIVLQELNGTFSFDLGETSGYQGSPPSGEWIVNGNDIVKAFAFDRNPAPSPGSTALGLPAGESLEFIAGIVLAGAAVVIAGALFRRRQKPSSNPPVNPDPPSGSA